MTPNATDTILGAIVDEMRRRQRFVVTSHARPDGDAIGSSMAMAYALRHLGKDVRVVSSDPAAAAARAVPRRRRRSRSHRVSTIRATPSSSWSAAT